MLSDRYFEEQMPSGPEEVRGKTLDRDKFGSMVDEYYKIHGWDKKGVPEPAKLKELGLEEGPGHEL